MMKSKKNKKIKYLNTNEKNMINRKIIITCLIIILVIIIFLINFNKNTAKISKIGNNSSSQEIVDYILNISSYESEVDIEVESNKNNNKYKMKQKYIKDGNSEQEIIEPSNIQGVKIIRENNILKLENTKLSLTKIIENYNEITQNNLDLINFIENYKNNPNSKFTEKNNQIIMETVAKTENNYQKYETLYVSKENGKPEKLEIKDTNQNTIIYIIYNKIEVNENKKIYAFKIYNKLLEI